MIMHTKRDFEDELLKKSKEMDDRILRKQELMKELREQNIKHIPNNIIMIEKIKDKIIFLERGKGTLEPDDSAVCKAGYKHILANHGSQLIEKKGDTEGERAKKIPAAKLPSTLFYTLRNSEKVGNQGHGDGRLIYPCSLSACLSDSSKAEKIFLAMSIGKNGYFVGVNLTSDPSDPHSRSFRKPRVKR
jgi:hypothetical protein